MAEIKKKEAWNKAQGKGKPKPSREDSNEQNEICGKKPSQGISSFRGDQRPLSFLFLLVSPVTTPKSSPLSGLGPEAAAPPWPAPLGETRGPLSKGVISPILQCARCQDHLVTFSLCPLVPSLTISMKGGSNLKYTHLDICKPSRVSAKLPKMSHSLLHNTLGLSLFLTSQYN